VGDRIVGIFGGTFDPPHIGHLVAAQDVVEALGLDELRLVVAARPPHKEPVVAGSADARLRMVRAAIEGDGRLTASRIELDRPGASYTVDTLRAIRSTAPDLDLRLVVGADQLAAFDSWKEPEEVARLARLTVMDREGQRVSSRSAGGLDVTYDTVAVTRIDVSSTLVRRRVAEGRSVRYLVPHAVRHIIEEEGLYAQRAPRTG